MNSNKAIDFRNPVMVRNAGMSALRKELGIVGTAYFMRQLSVGKGDYTAGRVELLRGVSSKEIAEGIRGIQSMANANS